jgi:hypothetical protein
MQRPEHKTSTTQLVVNGAAIGSALWFLGALRGLIACIRTDGCMEADNGAWVHVTAFLGVSTVICGALAGLLHWRETQYRLLYPDNEP